MPTEPLICTARALRIVLVLGPRLSDLAQLEELGRQRDIPGLARAVIASLAEAQLAEIDTFDPTRAHAIAECARLWSGVANEAAKLQPEIAKPANATVIQAHPMPFDIGHFERRTEIEEKST